MKDKLNYVSFCLFPASYPFFATFSLFPPFLLLSLFSSTILLLCHHLLSCRFSSCFFHLLSFFHRSLTSTIIFASFSCSRFQLLSLHHVTLPSSVNEFHHAQCVCVCVCVEEEDRVSSLHQTDISKNRRKVTNQTKKNSITPQKKKLL